MKKKILTIILLIVLGSDQLIAQIASDDQLMMKYWYYRNRLINDFMIGIGGGSGESIPAEWRNENNHTIVFGEGPIKLSYYIVILVTEYNILHAAHQNTDQTLMELFYAMNAINRLDFNAESCYNNGTNDLNGFFIRDDVGYGQTLLSSYFGNNIQLPAVADHLNHGNYLNALSSNSYISHIQSDWSGMFYNPNNVTGAQNEESLDMVIHILMAMRTVADGLPQTLTYNSNFFPYESTSIASFVLEAIRITKRIVNHIHNPYTPPTPFNWFIFNSATGNPVGAGSSFYALAYGLSKTYHKITGQHNPITLYTFSDPDWWLIKSMYNFTYTFYPGIYIWSSHTRSEGLKFLNLTTASKCCNATGSTLSLYSYIFGDYPSDQIPLFYQYFYGGNNLGLSSYYDNLLGDAPCEGPYNNDNHDYASYEWSSVSRTINPDARGAISGSHPGFYSGQYNGIDYMLLYNLYIITHHTPFFYQDNYYINSYDANVIHDFPYTYNNFPFPVTFGEQSTSPLFLPSYNSITAANTIHSNADVTFRAGKQIDFNPGFNVEQGGLFTAYVEPIQCLNGVTYLRSSNTNSNLPPSPLGNKIKELVKKDKVTEIGLSVFPVPFNKDFNFRIGLPEPANVDLSIYSIYGQKIATIYTNDKQEAGEFFTSYKADNLSSGVYICKLKVNNQIKTIKVNKSN